MANKPDASYTLSNTKLLNKKEAMTLFYHHKKIKQTVTDASHSTANDVLDVWPKANYSNVYKETRCTENWGLFKGCVKLKKNKENKRKQAKNKEEDWQASSADLFDIANAQVIQEGRQFQLAQHEAGYQGKMGD